MGKSFKAIAVTGGMGSGQSSFAKFLKDFGAKVIDADKIAHEVSNFDSEVKRELKHLFGKDIYNRNGKLKRKFLARIVFDDHNKTQLLNSIIHPHMVSRIIEEIEKAKDSGRYKLIVVDAALVYEASLEKMFDYAIVIFAKMQTRIQRIKERDGSPQREIMKRIRRQLPLEDKVKWADFVVRNDGSLDDLKEEAKKIFKILTNSKSNSKERKDLNVKHSVN
jgi:dephospho-CoA kinase